MENENKSIFVCRKCQKTYSFFFYNECECPNCKSKLEKMPISTDEWSALSDANKENYKNSFLYQTKSLEDKKYIYKSATPLAWHKFNRYFRVPFTLIQLFVNFNVGNYDLVTILQCFLILMFFIGSFNWMEYAWVCIIGSNVIGIFTAFIEFLLSGFDINYLGAFIGVSIVYGLEINYYIKREKLFNGSKEDPVEVFEFKPDYSKNTNDLIETSEFKDEQVNIDLSKSLDNETNDAIRFCKNCGAKLKDNAEFCHKCGTKIG